MTTSVFLDQLYTKFLFRTPDAEGKAYWIEKLDTSSVTAEQATLSFINSTEYQSTAAALTKLYFQVFDRIPDHEGLTYWVESMHQGQSLQDIANSFVQSTEFAQKYANATTDSEFLDTLYQHALGRGSDDEGKAYWLGKMSEGFSQANVITSFAASDEFDTLKGNDVQISAIYHGILNRSPTANELASAADNKLSLISSLYSSDDYEGTAIPGTAQISGKLIDGYIKGATVFSDDNGNGKLDEGEVSTITDSDGDFTLAGSGNLVAFGGTDISTGLAFNGSLKAPAGSTVITPITTVIAEIAASGKSVEEATKAVKQALDLPQDVNLQTFDPVNEATNASSDSSTVEKALLLQTVNVQVANMLVQSAAVVTGASNNEVSTQEAMNATIKALAEKISVSAEKATKVDLTDSAVVEETVNKASDNALDLMTDSAKKADIKNTIKGLADEAAKVLSDANRQIQEALTKADTSDSTKVTAALKTSAKVQTITQGEAATAIYDGAAKGDLKAVQDSFSGQSLTQAAESVEISDEAFGNNRPTTPTPTPTPTNSGGDPTPVAETITYHANTLGTGEIIGTQNADDLSPHTPLAIQAGFIPPEQFLTGYSTTYHGKGGDDRLTGTESWDIALYHLLPSEGVSGIIKASKQDDETYLISDDVGPLYNIRLSADGTGQVQDLRIDNYDEGTDTLVSGFEVIEIKYDGTKPQWLNILQFSNGEHRIDGNYVINYSSPSSVRDGYINGTDMDNILSATAPDAVAAGLQPYNPDARIRFFGESGNDQLIGSNAIDIAMYHGVSSFHHLTEPSDQLLPALQSDGSALIKFGNTELYRLTVDFHGNDIIEDLYFNNRYEKNEGTDTLVNIDIIEIHAKEKTLKISRDTDGYHFSGTDVIEYLSDSNGGGQIKGTINNDILSAIDSTEFNLNSSTLMEIEGKQGDDSIIGGQGTTAAVYNLADNETDTLIYRVENDSIILSDLGNRDLYKVELNEKGTGTVTDMYTANYDHGNDSLTNIDQVSFHTSPRYVNAHTLTIKVTDTGLDLLQVIGTDNTLNTDIITFI